MQGNIFDYALKVKFSSGVSFIPLFDNYRESYAGSKDSEIVQYKPKRILYNKDLALLKSSNNDFSPTLKSNEDGGKYKNVNHRIKRLSEYRYLPYSGTASTLFGLVK